MSHRRRPKLDRRAAQRKVSRKIVQLLGSDPTHVAQARSYSDPQSFVGLPTLWGHRSPIEPSGNFPTRRGRNSALRYLSRDRGLPVEAYAPNLDDQIRACLHHAADCAECASEATNPEDWLALEVRYLTLVYSIQFSRRLNGFCERKQLKGSMISRKTRVRLSHIAIAG